jgi:hypothetical protein
VLDAHAQTTWKEEYLQEYSEYTRLVQTWLEKFQSYSFFSLKQPFR